MKKNEERREGEQREEEKRGDGTKTWQKAKEKKK
jgi:hypothetical protein